MHYHILNLCTQNPNLCACTCLWFQYSRCFLLTSDITPAVLPALCILLFGRYLATAALLCGMQWQHSSGRLWFSYVSIQITMWLPECNFLCAYSLGRWYIKSQQTPRSLWHFRSAFDQVPLPKYLLLTPHSILHSQWPPLTADSFSVLQNTF